MPQLRNKLELTPHIWTVFTKYHPNTMSLNSAIAHCIREASDRNSLNAYDIDVYNHNVCWKSVCGGPIGEIVFRVPIRRFETNIDEGVGDVSTLISFATLMCREENHTLAERIRMALCDYGAPLYFKLVENMRRVIVYIGLPNRDTYTTLEIEYTNDETTGEYNWIIPDSEDLYSRINDDECIPSLGRATSMYEAVGLYATQSEGMCVRSVSQSIREQSGYPETCSDPVELDEPV